MADDLPRMYTDLASWFHLITAPEEYAEEAAFYFEAIAGASDSPPRTLLELGSGGGNNAFFYKHHTRPTLTDLSPAMLELSEKINPECEHIQGDMRTLRLGREFDAVFAHDAVSYLTTEDDLRQAMQTAFVHLRAGGVALFAPDHVRETFSAAEASDCGGNDRDGRAARYLEWTFDPDPSDTTYIAEYVYLLHEAGKPTQAAYDRHVCGLFSRADWLRLLADVGFLEATSMPFEHSEVPPGSLEVFVARKERC
jgi:SAM-dependent methyltransferase